MTAPGMLRLPEQKPRWASETSDKAQQTIRGLACVGKEYGIPTSLTELEWSAGTSLTERRFQELAATWREECGHLSSIREMALHPAYQQIIGMGPAVLRCLLDELEREPDHWFWALGAITGENPVSPENRGRIRAMAQDWLEWAVSRGLR